MKLACGDGPSVPLATVNVRAPVLQPPTVRDHIAFEEHATGPCARGKRTYVEVWARLPIFYPTRRPPPEPLSAEQQRVREPCRRARSGRKTRGRLERT